jgi:carboxymethylenebutenolidase
MSAQDIKIAAADGGQFDCCLGLPATGPAPGVVIMSSIFGVDDDVRGNIDDLTAQGFVAAAPDLFWRGDGGPMPRTEEGMRRARARGALDRAAQIEQGVDDLRDVIAELERYAEFDGNVVVVGLCYGGPYAIIGPARLGCAAGISFHGTKVENYLDELRRVEAPVVLHWGDQDHAAPPEALEKIRAVADTMSNVELVVYPGVAHGYTAPSSTDAWDEKAASQSWRRALEILDDLRGGLHGGDYAPAGGAD